MAFLLPGLFSDSRGAPPSFSESNGEIARETSDPTSHLWYLYTDLAFTDEPGQPFREANTGTLEFQPSMPIALPGSWEILNFPDLVLATQGTPDGRQATGLQSFSWLSALSPPSGKQGFAWGVGPYLNFPVSSEPALGPSLWQAGLGGVLSWRARDFLTSVLVKSAWTTSEDSGEAGSIQIQYNTQYFFGNGYQVGLGRPRIEYTWNRNGVGGWDLPVGVDVGAIFHVGAVPVKILLEYDFYAMNDSRWEPEHLFKISFIPVLSDPFQPGTAPN